MVTNHLRPSWDDPPGTPPFLFAWDSRAHKVQVLGTVDGSEIRQDSLVEVASWNPIIYMCFFPIYPRWLQGFTYTNQLIW